MKIPTVNNILCIKCGETTKVINSRTDITGTFTLRRRCCKACGHRFSTKEEVKVIKRGRLPESSYILVDKDTVFENLTSLCITLRQSVTKAKDSLLSGDFQMASLGLSTIDNSYLQIIRAVNDLKRVNYN